MPPDCSGFELGTPAEDVYADPGNDGALEAYVKGIIRLVQQQMRMAINEQIEEIGGKNSIPQNQTDFLRGFLTPALLKLNDKVACYGNEEISRHLKHENIYVFVMDAHPESPTVLFNGNNSDLNGTSLEARDHLSPGEPKVSELFSEKLGMPKAGKSAYINYHWDGPNTGDDDLENFLQTGTVPGTSCKRSYIEVANMTALLSELPEFRGGSDSEWLWIFGSGTYPGDDVCEGEGDDDGGCAIMGAGHTYKGALFNLLLTVSVLFSVVLLKRRA